MDKTDSTFSFSEEEIEGLSKADYLKALEKLKRRDRVGAAGDVLATTLAGAGGAAGAGSAAALAGASTLLGSSALGGILGGVFVTTTPVGWVVGCAVAAGAVGYGLTRVVRSGEKQDVARKKHCERILQKIRRTKYKQGNRYKEFINLVIASLEQDLITRELSQRLINSVESGAMSIEIAIAHLNRMLNAC